MEGNSGLNVNQEKEKISDFIFLAIPETLKLRKVQTQVICYRKKLTDLSFHINPIPQYSRCKDKLQSIG